VDVVPELRAALDGRVIGPGDADYDEARRVFAGAVDKRPAAIARAAGAADVSRAVSLARETGLEVAVRSGGHSSAGHGVSEGGIVIDLAGMRALEIDVPLRTAWAETGLTAAEYTTAAGEHGLATGFGDAGSVGLGGITLGGGVGFLSRKFGLTIDDLLAADVVTADGELLRVDSERHPDLFWALRGGGGNFGVATRLKFRLRDVPAVVGGMLVLPASPAVLAGFVAQADAAPDELSTIANVMRAPPLSFIPPEHHGRLAVLATMVYAGSREAGERAIAPFRALAEPIADLVRPIAYPEMYEPADSDYRSVATARSRFVDSVDREAGEAIVEHLENATAPMAVAQLRVLGGAIARVPADATAYAHRSRRVMATVAAVHGGAGDAAAHDAWVAGLAAALDDGTPGVYVNFLADEGEARVRAAYPGATWDRLAEVKARYDPGNLFRLNQNIPPASSGTAAAAA
jgi:FAD/FMN-containing dehydrogenase